MIAQVETVAPCGDDVRVSRSGEASAQRRSHQAVVTCHEDSGVALHDLAHFSLRARRHVVPERAELHGAPNDPREKCETTRARPATPIRSARSGSTTRRASASAKASAVGATRKPVSASSTVSSGPPSATATTGRPLAMASTGTNPKCSCVGVYTRPARRRRGRADPARGVTAELDLVVESTRARLVAQRGQRVDGVAQARVESARDGQSQWRECTLPADERAARRMPRWPLDLLRWFDRAIRHDRRACRRGRR